MWSGDGHGHCLCPSGMLLSQVLHTPGQQLCSYNLTSCTGSHVCRRHSVEEVARHQLYAGGNSGWLLGPQRTGSFGHTWPADPGCGRADDPVSSVSSAAAELCSQLATCSPSSPTPTSPPARRACLAGAAAAPPGSCRCLRPRRTGWRGRGGSSCNPATQVRGSAEGGGDNRMGQPQAAAMPRPRMQATCAVHYELRSPHAAPCAPPTNQPPTSPAAAPV